MTDLRIGIDIGGTFTDLVAAGPGGLLGVAKVSSTPDDYSRAIAEGLVELLGRAGLEARQVEELVHGTTVATNAVLERRGARTGLLTTAGFRDVLELRRIRAPALYDMTWDKPKPLVERYLRLEVDERIDHTGAVTRPLDRESARRALERLGREGVESIAVCLINSYVNGEHERALAALAGEVLPGVPVSLSVDVVPEIREYERTSTTVVNAYVRPLVARYLRSLEERLGTLRMAVPLLVMQSNGGVAPAALAAEQPVHLLESGPAAGVIAAAHLACRLDLPQAISFDMGGTTAKAALIEHGRVTYSREMEVGAPLSFASKLMKGGGYPVRTAMIDVAEVGAGAGSIARLDVAGGIHVGPQSAGAVPGPACYGLGGEEPTVTDANVVLGYINPARFLGGSMRLDGERACRAIAERVAGPLGRSAEEIAYGIHQIANATMTRAVKAVTTERGRDVREFTLVAFGGSGPVHAAGIARAIGIPRVVIPPIAGLFSAAGLLLAAVERHAVRTLMRPVRDLEQAWLAQVVREMADELRPTLSPNGAAGDDLRIEGFAEMRYRGQSYELTVPFFAATGATLSRLSFDLDQLVERFSQEHERSYGHRASNGSVELVNLQVVGRRVAESPSVLDHGPRGAPNGQTGRRRAYFGPELGWVEATVVGRADLGSSPLAGPAIVDEYDTAVVVPPGVRIARDGLDNLVIEVGS